MPINDILRNRINEFYTSELRNLVLLDYMYAVKEYALLGGTPGIYPDSLIFIYRLMWFYGLKNIIEYGSGFSSVFLAHFCKKFGGQFVSYEEKPDWHAITQKFLVKYGLDPDAVHLLPEKVPRDYDYHIVADILFLDSSQGLREEILTKVRDTDNMFIIIDDSEALDERIVQYLRTNGIHRRFFTYSGAGRVSRVFFVSYPEHITDINFFMQTEMNYLG